MNFQKFKLDLQKSEEPETKLPISIGSLKSKRDPEKHLLLFNDYIKAFDYVDHKKLWKILKERGNTRPPDLPPEKSVCRSRSNSSNWIWNNRLVPNLESSM